jgi:hypothetical protein
VEVAPLVAVGVEVEDADHVVIVVVVTEDVMASLRGPNTSKKL